MNLIHSRPPHVRSHESNFSVMGDMVISLVPLYLMAYFFYGSRTLVLGAVSVITCTVLDFLCTFLSSRRVGILDLSPVVTGLLIPLMLPASIGFTPVIAADLFAIGVIKQPFGGLGQNIFNPAAGGVAFAVLTWSDSVFRYPVPIESLGNAAARLVSSPAASLRLGATPSYPFTDIFLGIYPGPMGGTGVLILLACFGYLVIRKTISWRPTAAFLGTAALAAFCFPRITTGRFQSVLYELTSGLLLFGAIFLINDPATSPKSQMTRTIYAAIAGVVAMIFRYLGAYEEGLVFAILLMNAFSLFIDMHYEKIRHRERRALYAEQQTETV